MTSAGMVTAPGSWGDQHTLTRLDRETRESSERAGGRDGGEEVVGAHCLMMRRGVMLGEIVGPISVAGPPKDMEITLARAVADPVKAHVNCFGAALFDGVIDNATGSIVVSLEWGGRLRVAQLLQGNANGANGLGVEEKGTQFSLGGTGDNLTHDLTQDMHGAVVRRCRISGSGRGSGPGAEEGVPCSAGAALGGREIRSVTVCPEYQ